MTVKPTLIGSLWRFAGPERWQLAVIYVLLATASAISMLEPFVLGRMLNTIQTGGSTALPDILTYLLLFASFTPLFWMLNGPARILERMLSFRVAKNFSEYLFSVVASLPLSWHRNHHSGSTIDKIGKASNALRQFSGDGYIYIDTIVRFIGAVIAIMLIVPFYGFLIVLVSILVLWVIIQFDKVLVKNMREMNRKNHRVTSVLYDYISNIVTVISLRLEWLAKNEIARNMIDLLPEFRKNARLNEAKWFTVSMLLMLMNFALMFLYIQQRLTLHEVILIGNMTALFQYVERLIDVFYRTAWQYEKFVWEVTDMHAVDDVIAAHAALAVPDTPGQIGPDWRKIEITGLTFRHEDQEHDVHTLRSVDLTLKRGERIALVGESGSGKSTLLLLLRALEQPDAVRLVVDGQEYPNLQPLAAITTLVMQDPEIFENTIAYNITAGVEHTKEDIQRACSIARFTSVLERLPKGLETDIKEKGVNLSGGEKQRLALARGIFAAHNSSLLLLDEPTSSVDARNEVAIYKALFQKFESATIVSSVHRLHLLKDFDRIIVMEKGAVIEVGTFTELVSKRGALHALWQHYEKSTAPVLPII